MEREAGAWESAEATVLDYAARDENAERVAQLVGQLLRKYAWPPYYQRFFGVWEDRGVHVTPVHFYHPIPDTRTLPEVLWEKESALPGVDMNDATQLRLVREIFPRFRDEYDRFASDPTDCPHEFYFNNGFFGGTDALALYCMVRHLRPALVVEVGAGFSSRVCARALSRNGHGELVCIEPFPDDVLRHGFPGLTALVTKGVEEVGLDTFGQLKANDILFIDSSHVVKIGGDVNYLFQEVLPRLAPGVVVHVHDIFFPLAGRREWVMEERRFWTEQDLLQAFLAFNSAYEVLLCNCYVSRKYKDALRETFPKSPWWGGGSFWMRRKAA